MEEMRERIFDLHSEEDFDKLCLDIFRYQYRNNDVYSRWCDLLGRGIGQVNRREDIPFLPIGFFRTHKVISFKEEPIAFFKSSGTSSASVSRHWIRTFDLYEKSFLSNFEQFFGKAEDYCFIALLPNYQQQGNSSLVYMMKGLIARSKYSESGFYPHEVDKIRDLLLRNETLDIPTILFGVSYALLDLAEAYSFNLQHTTVFETGGMKGHRKELPKQALHKILCKFFGVQSIASEYGMCELFSQAYSKSDGLFRCPKQMKVEIKEVNDPFSDCATGKTGVINITDLANVDTCSFIATEDVGRLHEDGSFEISGRLDNAAIKGCNLMYEL